ncbi:MAG: hypothetical protein K0R49_1161 [Burkholderiales bacterium]|jgi:hypothetical protein|nr:hypothetical protein [Burkholderiales bacterium]MCE3268909.1 hypothetical protein [Burkholderiales bacterium]
MYYFVERSVAVIKPKLPFLEWVNNTFQDTPQPLTLDSIRIDCNSYLIPEMDEIEDGVNYIDDKFADLFALELASWTEDESLWPQAFTLKMFWEWFDVEVYPTAIDISEENIGEEDHDRRPVSKTTIH